MALLLLFALLQLASLRATFDAALEFSKADHRGGQHPIIHHQSVADLLIQIKTRLETSRYLCWKALQNLEKKGDPELAYMAKIYGSECAVQCLRRSKAGGRQ